MQGNSSDTAADAAARSVALPDLDVADAMDGLGDAWEALTVALLSWNAAAQAAAIVGAGLAALLLSRPARRLVERAWPAGRDWPPPRVRAAVLQLLLPALWLILLWAATAAMQRAGADAGIARTVASLLTAWVVIRLFSSAVADPFWAQLFAVVAWLIAALNILHLLGPAVEVLDSAALTLGQMRLSLYVVLKGAIVGALLLWGASAMARLLQSRLRRAERLTPSVRVLVAQLVRFTLIFVAVVVALNVVGIDLTAIAVLSGAIGVGIGFGLQRIVANLVSGIILLLDNSIKPGDVIEIGDSYGWVTSLGARYASVLTRDGTEHLIPNEVLIANTVINWTHSNNMVRRKVDIGVAYGADVEAAMTLVTEACGDVGRILKSPAPRCLLTGFGDSSVNLQARFWIQDANEGVSNVASELLLAVWRRFRANDIEIPFPQRDLHLRSVAPAIASAVASEVVRALRDAGAPDGPERSGNKSLTD
ncbi:MAG: mechanosensitive ion channel family protein [Rhodospirillaceae bacterium]